MSRVRRGKSKSAPLPAKVDKPQRSITAALIFMIVFLSGACFLYLKLSTRVSGNGKISSRSAHIEAPSPDAAAAAPAGFQPTTENHQPAPDTAPKGMVWIPGGEFSMGANDPPDMDDVGMKATLDARPIHRVYVDGFYMDRTDVTNAEFAEFVKATGYVTIAEPLQRQKSFPARHQFP